MVFKSKLLEAAGSRRQAGEKQLTPASRVQFEWLSTTEMALPGVKQWRRQHCPTRL
jgi:hypothetical protein